MKASEIDTEQWFVLNVTPYPVIFYQIQEAVEYGVNFVVTGREHTGSQKSLDALKTPGCALVQDNWLFDSYWSMSMRDVKPYLIGVGKGKIPAISNPPSAEMFLKKSYTDLSQPTQRAIAGFDDVTFGPNDMIGLTISYSS